MIIGTGQDTWCAGGDVKGVLSYSVRSIDFRGFQCPQLTISALDLTDIVKNAAASGTRDLAIKFFRDE